MPAYAGGGDGWGSYAGGGGGGGSYAPDGSYIPGNEAGQATESWLPLLLIGAIGVALITQRR
jgi:hypothetical protein